MAHFTFINFLLALIIVSVSASSLYNLPLAINNDQKTINYAPIVNLKNGQIRGFIKKYPLVNSSSSTDPSQTDVFFYQGFRYGHVDERFTLAKPVPAWNGLYDATRSQFACPQPISQNQLNNGTIEQSEDCLYLNLWTTNVSESNLRPVMVWIHGGGYTSGTIFADIHDGGILAANGDVVVVSIAYRLGAFGFLYSGDEQAPGNQGLHDQILALKWVQENIHKFGGDPKQVTIFGESAGGMAVGSLVISPLAKGLFKRAILQSGSPNSEYGAGNQTRALNKMHKFAEKHGCNKSNDSKTIIECLRKLPMKELIQLDLPPMDLLANVVFTPIYGDKLMPEKPTIALKNRHVNPVDMMFGVTDNEGTIFLVNYLIEEKKLNYNYIKELMEQILKQLSFKEEALKFCTKHINDNSTVNELRQAAANCVANITLVCPTIFFGETMAEKFPDHHFYSYRLMQHMESMEKHGYPKWLGVIHSLDLYFLFGIPFQAPTAFTKHELDVSRDMIMAWTRFAHNGTQTTIGDKKIHWDEALVNAENHTIQFMAIIDNDYRMIKNYYKDNCDAFWKKYIF